MWVAIGMVLAGLTLLFYYRNRQTTAIEKIDEAVKQNKTLFTEQDAKNALAVVASKYGKTLAAQIEKVARLETAHFTSKQYKLTGTGGMEAHGSAPYYGWYSPFFVANPSYTPVGTTDMLENTGASQIGGNPQSSSAKIFVIMPSVEAWMMFLADYAQRNADNGGILRWYSTQTAQQQIYANSLKNISTPITNNLA